MSGFDELVARTRRELESVPVPERAAAEADLERCLLKLERCAEPFELRAGADASLLKRAVAGLLRVTGLARHLGANQARANRATLEALRALEARVRELERRRGTP